MRKTAQTKVAIFIFCLQVFIYLLSKEIYYI